MLDRMKVLACMTALLALSVTACGPNEDPPPKDTTPPVQCKTDETACGSYCCITGEICDDSMPPFQCLSACWQENDQEGCREATQDCNADTGKCQNKKCGLNQCDDGQGCVTDKAPATPAASGTLCGCFPDDTDTEEVDEESCIPYGLMCDYAASKGVPGSCVLPTENRACKPKTGEPGGTADGQGCAAGLDCVDFNKETGEAPSYRCMKACDSINDCQTYQRCFDKNDTQLRPAVRGRCYINYCGEVTGGSKLFEKCDSAGTNDGFCQPFQYTGTVTGTNERWVGLCELGGTAASEGKCTPGAKSAELAKICPAGEYCIEDGYVGGEYQGHCAKPCNAQSKSDRSPALDCANATDLCFSLFGINAPPDKYDEPFLPGACRAKCDLFTSAPGACPVDQYGFPGTCDYYLPYVHAEGKTGLGVCKAAIKDAPKLGEACTFADDASDDFRNVCAEGICVAKTGETKGYCAAWCGVDTGKCAKDQTTACPSMCAYQTCATGALTDAECKPDCTGKACGSDGCGGFCKSDGTVGGSPLDPAVSDCHNNAIVPAGSACVPNCHNKFCGDDGCGHECGTACAAGSHCKIGGKKDVCANIFGNQQTFVLTGVCTEP